MIIVAVFHDEKVAELGGLPDTIRANPPMTTRGMERILRLVPVIRARGPFKMIYTSLMARGLDAASVLALELQILRLVGLAEFGQFANSDGEEIVYYPGHEGEGPADWQRNALNGIKLIQAENHLFALILLVSHRPIIGALVAAAHGISLPEEILSIVIDPELTRKGYVIFETDPEGGINML
jgi:broad specificity phosphatase PhoE